jgi:hypothetical protein
MAREFMSAGVAVMEAEGLLRFDDKVKSYIPKLPEWSKDVTIQDLHIAIVPVDTYQPPKIRYS